MRRIHHRTSISPDRVPWRRRIAEAGTGAVLAAGMATAASGPAAAGGPDKRQQARHHLTTPPTTPTPNPGDKGRPGVCKER
jgi:hypothetical protein